MPSVTRAPIERRIVSGGQIPVTFECVFKSQWAAITSQISCKGITVLSAYCQLLHWKLFALHFHVKISQAFYGSLGQSVKNTYPLCTFLFIRLVLFPAQCYSCWISFFFYRFEAENVLVLLLHFLNVVSVLACIALSMYRS